MRLSFFIPEGYMLLLCYSFFHREGPTAEPWAGPSPQFSLLVAATGWGSEPRSPELFPVGFMTKKNPRLKDVD